MTTKPSPLQAPKGMHDILPHDQPYWERVRKVLRDVAGSYHFVRIDTPAVEAAELFRRTVGADTDVVEKQMFRVETKESAYVLRPEETAPIGRAYVEHGLGHLAQPLKVYFEGSLFRYEQPQAGRYREFHQVEFDIISGEDDPIYDAQIMLAAFRFLEEMRVKGVRVSLNTVGCRMCRPNYRRELQNYYSTRTKLLCADCIRRFKTNPLRLLDCKNEGCVELRRETPLIIDHLCRTCHDHYKCVLEYLEELKLPYLLDHHLVRGLDYYTRTVFEFGVEDEPAALGGGGRFNHLIESLGGKAAPAVGVALGIERLVEILKKRQVAVTGKERPPAFLVAIGALAKKKALGLIEEFRRQGVHVAEALGKESLKAQLRAADRFRAPLALIYGQKEAFEETVIVRDLVSGVQETIPLKRVVEIVKRRLKEPT